MTRVLFCYLSIKSFASTSSKKTRHLLWGINQHESRKVPDRKKMSSNTPVLEKNMLKYIVVLAEF